MSQPLCPEWSGRARTNTRGFTSKDQAALVGGVIGAVFLMMAAGFAAWSARPVPFDIPGNHPEQWFQGRNAEIVGMLGGEPEQTAITLSAPFREPRGDRVSHPCPVSATRYDGSYRDLPLSGSAHFTVENGICIGTISIDGAIADWFNGAPQKDAASLKIIGLDGDGGLAPAALVTPYGAFDLRPDAGRYVTRFNSTRSLSVNFH